MQCGEGTEIAGSLLLILCIGLLPWVVSCRDPEPHRSVGRIVPAHPIPADGQYAGKVIDVRVAIVKAGIVVARREVDIILHHQPVSVDDRNHG